MSNLSALRLWSMRAAFVAFAMLILLGDLLPLQTLPRGWAGPDLLLCLAMVLAVRAPDYVPITLLAVIFLLADFLLSRPPGLMATLMLLACHDLQSRMKRNRDAGIFGEWLRAGILIFAVILVYRLVLAVVLVPTPPIGLAVFQAFVTTLAYPLVIGLAALVFGVRLSTSREFDGMGQRI